MLSALSDAGVEYLIVGAHAVAVHATPRATGALDIWVRPTPTNAARVWRALKSFGAPLEDISLEARDLIFQIGIAPNRIDILTDIGQLRFDEAWGNRVLVEMQGLLVPVIGRAELIRAKREVGRPRDLADVADLERSEGS
jgi:hypothetical protein